MRVRWPDENRKQVATRYATAAAKYKQELLGKVEPKDLAEGKKALQGLNPWAKRARFEELVRWLGEFDSARTLLEEWPAMRRFAEPHRPKPGESSKTIYGVRYGKRMAGGPPPEWMRGWLPLVSEWQGRQRRESGFQEMASVLRSVYSTEVLEKRMMESNSFLEYFRRKQL